MIIEDYIPTERLQPFVKAYKIIESPCQRVNRVLPGTSLAMAFRFRGQNHYITGNTGNNLPAVSITGLRRSARLIGYEKDTGTIVVQFKEGGAGAFFKEPLHQLFGESIGLDHFVSQGETGIIEEQLSTPQHNHQRIALIEQFLLSKLYNHKPDSLILSALDRIHAAKGMVKIKEIAGSLFISNDAFEKRFRKSVGASPKQFASIVRMASVVNQKMQGRSLTDLAFDAGYFDQPHFNKDFRLFTGQTPGDFFSTPPLW